MSICSECGFNALGCDCIQGFQPRPDIDDKIEAVQHRLTSIESKLAELVDLLSCDDCDCEDEE